MNISPSLEKDAKEKSIDLELSIKIMEDYNNGLYQGVKPIEFESFPQIDGNKVVNLSAETFTFAKKNVETFQESFSDVSLEGKGSIKGNSIIFTEEEVIALGEDLLPYYSYGVLNGGSATSYADRKKNSSFNKELLQILSKEFDALSEKSTGNPKGVTPAYMNSDGSLGASFLELKMRSLLLDLKRLGKNEKGLAPGLPMFQMTSVLNNSQVQSYYEEYKNSPYLKSLIEYTGFDITQMLTGQQPMLAAFTSSKEGETKSLFTRANNQNDSLLALPGGHGQNFYVLKEVYKKLLALGKKFVSIGNVDNMGYTSNPKALALLALSGREAAFEFSFKTPVDVKGGVLIVDSSGHLNCGDLGAAISKEVVTEAEQGGTPVLFNCATGLFNLEYLVKHIDDIIRNLPMRFSDQDKDAGIYSQAEQITWEVLGILPDPLILGVDKYDRFLAAKMLLETLMTSGIKLDSKEYPKADDPAKDLKSIALKLHAGLKNKLSSVYGLKEKNGTWKPELETLG